MRITATQIENWADTREAQGLLPILIRRLVLASCKPTQLAIAGGDSVIAPGWDGQLTCADGNAWIPVGGSRWEMGCSSDAIEKARCDYKKRSDKAPSSEAADLTFVFVTPRRWPQKDKWLREAAATNHWKAVRAIDADDLEAWLEATPSVSVWFGEQIGARGAGIESIDARWEAWSQQAQFPISLEAISSGREEAGQAYEKAILEKPVLIAVQADSCEEAVAFACAKLLQMQRASSAACVADASGWLFVDANPQLEFVICGSAEVASSKAPRTGATLIVPLSIGDNPNTLAGSAAKGAAGAAPILLKRPTADVFEKAIIALGEDESDARRLSRSTGRSWSVYRRVRARNPAVRKPAWASGAPGRTLAIVTLVGAWDSQRAGDKACVEAVADRPYDEIEADLRSIARLDDSPLIQIGSIWKAKAPIELLHQLGPEITAAQLRRFFAIADAILHKPDPALALDNDKRWAAAVYGKVREESGLVIDAIVDSVAKLSVYAENSDDANANEIISGVDRIIRGLLGNADEQRWLSLAGVLRELAEASPDEFLKAVESSLARDDAPVRRLLTETESSSSFGRCWHSDLLWALELLAWYPTRLGRIANILAQLSSTGIKGNWGNTPFASLASLFRYWWPQTTATTHQRLAVIDRLLKNSNSVAWDLLCTLAPTGPQSAIANAKPRWREDDAGSRIGASSDDVGWYLSEIGQRLLSNAGGDASRIARLTKHLDHFEGEFREELVRMIEGASIFDDDGREMIRDRLRSYLNWHNSYNRDGDRGTREIVDRLRPCFDALAPADIVRRHRWLFEKRWLDLPDGREGDYQERDRLVTETRRAVLQEIFDAEGWTGFSRLSECAGDPWMVGWESAKISHSSTELIGWAADRFLANGSEYHCQLLSGVLHAIAVDLRPDFVLEALGLLPEGKNPETVAAFLSAAPCDRETWQIVERFPEDAQRTYWHGVRPGYVRENEADAAYLVDRLMEVNRHRTAFKAVDPQLKQLDAGRIFQLLDGIRAGADPDAPFPSAWHIGEAVEALENSGEMSRRELAVLEFAFHEALRHDKHGPKNLYAEMLSDPSLFMECVCLVYKPRNGPRESEPVDEGKQALARAAWSVLHNGRGMPGADASGTVDPDTFHEWLARFRTLARELDRAEVADTTLGQWLTSCPADPDGQWPCQIVCKLLDQQDAEDIRDGFAVGVYNGRGVTSRAYDEGGEQERALSTRYRTISESLCASHPHAAAMFENIAKSYERDARRNDDDAQLRIEGH